MKKPKRQRRWVLGKGYIYMSYFYGITKQKAGDIPILLNATDVPKGKRVRFIAELLEDKND